VIDAHMKDRLLEIWDRTAAQPPSKVQTLQTLSCVVCCCFLGGWLYSRRSQQMPNPLVSGRPGVAGRYFRKRFSLELGGWTADPQCAHRLSCPGTEDVGECDPFVSRSGDHDGASVNEPTSIRGCRLAGIYYFEFAVRPLDCSRGGGGPGPSVPVVSVRCWRVRGGDPGRNLNHIFLIAARRQPRTYHHLF
jgi:hypothetical protein